MLAQFLDSFCSCVQADELDICLIPPRKASIHTYHHMAIQCPAIIHRLQDNLWFPNIHRRHKWEDTINSCMTLPGRLMDLLPRKEITTLPHPYRLTATPSTKTEEDL